MARSKATQAMILECTKCRRGPRTSQMPSSGSLQCFSRNSSSCRTTAQVCLSKGRPACLPRVNASMTLAVDVKLALVHGGVADPHGHGSLIAGQPGGLPLGEPPFAGHPVHDLHVAAAPGYRALQPLAPGPGLGRVAG